MKNKYLSANELMLRALCLEVDRQQSNIEMILRRFLKAQTADGDSDFACLDADIQNLVDEIMHARDSLAYYSGAYTSIEKLVEDEKKEGKK